MSPDSIQALSALIAGGNLKDSVFRAMVEVLPVGIYTTDAEGRLTYFNKAAVKLSGRSPEIGTDQGCVTWKIFLPDGTFLPHDQCPMAVALSGTEVPAGIECMAERPDGSRFWFSPAPAVVRDAEGKIIGGINLLMDITDRKNAEIEANEHFRAVVETTPECVKIVKDDGTLLFMNAPGLAMVGASSPETLIGSSIYDLIAQEDRKRFRAMNQQVCRGEKASLEFDSSVWTEGGDTWRQTPLHCGTPMELSCKSRLRATPPSADGPSATPASWARSSRHQMTQL